MSRNYAEVIAGALTASAAAAFAALALSATEIGDWGGGRYEVTARFINASGLIPGADVRVSGVKVGAVRRHELDARTYEAVVSMSIDEAIRLPDDSSARIASDGILGDSFVAIEPGGSETMLSDGGEFLYTQDALDLWSLVGQFMDGDSE